MWCPSGSGRFGTTVECLRTSISTKCWRETGRELCAAVVVASHLASFTNNVSVGVTAQLRFPQPEALPFRSAVTASRGNAPRGCRLHAFLFGKTCAPITSGACVNWWLDCGTPRGFEDHDPSVKAAAQEFAVPAANRLQGSTKTEMRVLRGKNSPNHLNSCISGIISKCRKHKYHLAD